MSAALRSSQEARGTHPQPLCNLRLVLDIKHVGAGNHYFFQYCKRLGGKLRGISQRAALLPKRRLVNAP